jgi:hypothetical protein
LISESDVDLFTVTADPTFAAEEMCRFYANFHSQRYVDGNLVLRIRQAPTPEQLGHLNETFADIVVDGEITVIEPTPAEIADEDALDCARVSFHFDRRHYGRLRKLVDALNDLVPTAGRVSPPAPFGSEQADRSW